MATKKTTTAKKAPAKKKAAAKKPAAKKESGNPCWEGYEPVPGKAPGSKGSCKKEGS
jgi:hypothetical protein